MGKTIQKPKISDVIFYITNKNNIDLPESFQNINELKRILFYVFEYFWKFPKIIQYLNKYNFLFNDEGLRKIEDDPIEFIKHLKFICDENHIFRYQLKNEFFNLIAAKNKIKEIEEFSLKNKEQFIDTLTTIKIKEKLNLETSIKKHKNVKKNDKNFDELKCNIKNAVEAQSIKIQEIKKEELKTSNTILDEINEEIIKKYQLTLIDTYVNKNKNEIIYIFIDKDYQKKYYIEPFWFEFFINSEQGIINNDYLLSLNNDNKNKIYRYITHSFWDANRIKNAVKKNYENFMKIYEM